MLRDVLWAPTRRWGAPGDRSTAMLDPMKYLRVVFLAALGACSVSLDLARGAESTQTDKSSISYATLDAAIGALRPKPGVKFRDEGGWVVAEDMPAFTVWLFTPPGHPAYPSMVKRTLVNGPGGAYFETNVRCLASKDICDRYFGGK